MNRKVLFEIPVYSMSERAFNSRWEKKIINYASSFGNDLNAETVKRMKDHVYPRNVWKYNNIIGYIVVSIAKRDVYVDLYKTLDKRFYATRNAKHYIQNMNLSGTHFYATDKNDKELHLEIRELVNSIEKHNIKKSMFVDYTAFDNIFDSVNIRKIMEEL